MEQSKGKHRDIKEESCCEEKNGKSDTSQKKKKFTLNEHLRTFYVIERAKDTMLALIEFRKEYEPPWSTKPFPAPKPQGPAFSESGAATGSGSRGHSSDTALYSQVQKSRASGSWDSGVSGAGTDRTGAKSEGST